MVGDSGVGKSCLLGIEIYSSTFKLLEKYWCVQCIGLLTKSLNNCGRIAKDRTFRKITELKMIHF